jgi:hypothetical protein
MDDEPFLEACLDDNRKVVRESAQVLLWRLPESRLVQRMIERATPLLKLTNAGLRRKAAIEVNFPTELTAEMQRDGVIPWKKSDRFEEDAYYLAHLLFAIRPTFWCEHWDISGDDLYSALMNSPQKDVLLEVWTSAAVLTRDAAFDAILLSHEIEALNPADLRQIAAMISDETRELVILRRLQNDRDALKQNIQVVQTLLTLHHTAWSDELSQVFLATLDRYLNKGKVRPPRELYGIIQIAAVQMSPGLGPEMMRVLHSETSAEKMWADLVDEIRLLLEFRQEMLTAIHNARN